MIQLELYGEVDPAVWSLPLFSNTNWTLPWERRWVVAKAKQTQGTICEVGVFSGATTRELALSYPQRKVRGVDVGDFDSEKNYGVKGIRLGQEVEGLPNVEIHTVGFQHFVLTDEDFFFVDGNHTWGGVQHDTQKVLSWFRPSDSFDNKANGRSGVVVWHDYLLHPNPTQGVFHYLNSISYLWPLRHIFGTTLVYCQFP